MYLIVTKENATASCENNISQILAKDNKLVNVIPKLKPECNETNSRIEESSTNNNIE